MTDEISLSLRNGFYELEVTRDSRTIDSTMSEDFYGVLNQIQRYHHHCFQKGLNPNYHIHTGDRSNYDPRPFQWSIGAICELPKVQASCLRSLVSIHNQVMTLLEKSKRM